VQLTLLSRAPELLPDQTVTAEIVTGTRDGVLSLDQRFLRFEKGTASVFVCRAGRAQRAAVRVSDLGNGRFVVDEGVSAGDTLLFAVSLKDGAKVSLTE
jgi:hypothetical protein